MMGINFAYRLPVGARGDDEAAVREVLLRQSAAFERNDLAALSQHWAGDESARV